MTLKTSFIILALWVGCIPTFSQTEKAVDRVKTISILTIGNSFSGNASKFLPQIVRSVPDCEVEITEANIGGSSLEQHANLIAACEKDRDTKPYQDTYCLVDLLKQGPYDIVTIQQLSLLSFDPESYQPYANTIVDFVKQHAPDAEIVIHQTWAYAEDCPRFEKLDITRDEMQMGIISSYRSLAKDLNLDILPSGNAFYLASQKYPKIDLWSKDRYHANENGSYLAGCIWFGKLFGISSQKVEFAPESIDKRTAKRLRKIAHRELY